MKEYSTFIKNKRVALVGPAAYMVNSKFGEQIDSHDVVVRLNRGIESVSTYFLDIGARSDILYSCLIEKPGNAGPYDPKSLVEKFNIKAVVAPPHSDFRGMSHSTTLHELVDKKKASHLASLVPLRVVDHHFHNDLAMKVRCKPNTGFMAIYDLIRCGAKKLSIYGFSFYLDGFIPGCKEGVQSEQGLSEQGFAEKCFKSKRHIQENMWKHAKHTLLDSPTVSLDPILQKILNLERLDKDLFKEMMKNENFYSNKGKLTEGSQQEL